MTVVVKTILGESVQCPCEEGQPISVLKHCIHDRLGWSEASQRIVWKGKVLNNDSIIPSTEERRHSPLTALKISSISHCLVKANSASRLFSSESSCASSSSAMDHDDSLAAAPSVAPLPPVSIGGVRGHSLVKMGENKVLLFGGVQGGKYNNSLFQLDLDSLIWTQIETKGEGPPGRSELLAFRFDGKLWIGFGRQQSTWFNDIWSLDLDTLYWTKETLKGLGPGPRANLAFAVVDDRLFIHGGYGQNYQCRNETYMLNLNSLMWIKSPTLNSGEIPPALAGHTLTSVGSNGRLFLFGGLGENRIYNHVWKLDPDALKWRKLKAIRGCEATPMASHAAVSVGSRLLIIGGSDGRHARFNSIFSFETETETWTRPDLQEEERSIGPFEERCGHAVLKVSSNQILVIGGDDSHKLFSADDLHFLTTSL